MKFNELLYRYRSAGRDVIDAIKRHCNIVERASVDEAYLDVTDLVDKRMLTNNISLEQLTADLSHTFVVGHSEVGKNDEGEEKIIKFDCYLYVFKCIYMQLLYMRTQKKGG